MTNEEILALAEDARVWVPMGSGPEKERSLQALRSLITTALSRYGSSQSAASALQYAQHLAQSIFQRHYASDEAYASGRVNWSAQDDLSGVLTQIDNMTAGLVRQPAASAEPSADAQRYRRARILGMAPDGHACLARGTVLRFQALDDFLDADIKACASRGEAVAAPVAQEPIRLLHLAVADEEGLRWMSGRRKPDSIQSVELYAMPDGGRAPAVVYAAPVAAQAQPVVNQQMTTEPNAQDDETLADTQRAIIEAAEQRGYARAKSECGQDLEDAQRWRYIRQFLVLDDVGDEEYCLGLVVLDERLVESVTPHVGKLLSDGKRNPTVDAAIDAAWAAKGADHG